jgi:CheY-like chemotaxis protein
VAVGPDRRRGDHSLRVLLAEDNPVNQRVAELMLDRLGHRVDTVGTGIEAVRAAQSSSYDVVLMDVQMPQLDGLEATRQIVAAMSGRQRPYIVAMTASALVEDRDACAAAGMDGYLSKPVRARELGLLLAQVPAPGLAGRR